MQSLLGKIHYLSEECRIFKRLISFENSDGSINFLFTLAVAVTASKPLYDERKLFGEGMFGSKQTERFGGEDNFCKCLQLYSDAALAKIIAGSRENSLSFVEDTSFMFGKAVYSFCASTTFFL